MVEQNTVVGEEVVGFAIVDDLPVSVDFGTGIGATGVERSGFLLGDFLDLAKHFRGASLVVFEVDSSALAIVTNCFKQAQGTHANAIDGVFRGIEADTHVKLGSQL